MPGKSGKIIVVDPAGAFRCLGKGILSLGQRHSGKGALTILSSKAVPGAKKRGAISAEDVSLLLKEKRVYIKPGQKKLIANELFRSSKRGDPKVAIPSEVLYGKSIDKFLDKEVWGADPPKEVPLDVLLIHIPLPGGGIKDVAIQDVGNHRDFIAAIRDSQTKIAKYWGPYTNAHTLDLAIRSMIDSNLSEVYKDLTGRGVKIMKLTVPDLRQPKSELFMLRAFRLLRQKLCGLA